MKSVFSRKVAGRKDVALEVSFVLLALLMLCGWSGCSGCTERNEVTVEAKKLSDPSFLKSRPEVEPFATGFVLHNALPGFTRDELLPLKKGGLLVMDREKGFQNLDFPAQDKIGPVQCLAFEDGLQKKRLWVGTMFNGTYVLDFPSLAISEHYTLESTGIKGRAVSLSKNKLMFDPSGEVDREDMKKLSFLSSRGLYLKLNTEFFHVRSMDWPEFTVYTYGSHDLVHAGRTGPSGMDKVTLVTGLPDNTINDIVIDGDTLWIAAGRLGDKGLAGGIASFRNGEFTPRHPNSVFNKARRFNFQRSNAGYSLCKHGGRLWSGWAEIRGPKPWGGVSGNLLSFTGNGLEKDQWQDFTNPSCINPRNFSSTLHVSVPDVSPVRIAEGQTVQQCVAAATFGLNSINKMGTPGRKASGSGLRVICPQGLKALVLKEYLDNQQPAPGSPSSNNLFAVDTLHDRESGKVYAFAGTDAGLYAAELTSRLRRYFYEPPKSPAPAVLVGSDRSLGFYRSGEVLHGMTVGSAAWPPCLPDLFVKEVRVTDAGDKDNLELWVGTHGGAAYYSGPLESITDCSAWKRFYYHVDTGRMKPSSNSAPGPAGTEGLITVNSILPVEASGRKLVLMGLSKGSLLVGKTGAIKRALPDAARMFPQSPLDSIRLHRSAVYENSLETISLSDASVLNLYTREFHRKECSIRNPRCLAGDTALNWKHFDSMMDRIVKNDFTPTICLSAIPFIMYKDFYPKDPCDPPDPENPACSPSRKDWDFSRWENLVFAMVDHLYRRYGREKASQWVMEVWNEPAIEWEWRWNQTWAADYSVLYEHSKKAVQACNRFWDREHPSTAGMDISVAGPAWHGDPALPDARMEKMIETMKQKQLRPRPFTTHIYPFRRMSMGPYYEKAQQYMEEHEMEAPVYVTEYSPVMTQTHDGIGTLASGELSALFLLRSLQDLYHLDSPPRMMHFLEIQSPIFGARSNWAGMFSYLGAQQWAPRPLFNAMILAAQAGTIKVPVNVKGEPHSFARYDPRTGKIMLFVMDTNIQKLWQKMKNYNKPGKTSLELMIRGLPRKSYRVREFVIDSNHNNFLTAHWRAGSPPEPSKEEAGKIRRASMIKPLAASNVALPETIEGSSLQATLSMEKESIYAIELTPSPVLGTSGSTIESLRLAANKGGDVEVNWLGGGKEYGKRYLQSVRAWQRTDVKKAPANARQDKKALSASCTALTRFNGDTVKITFKKHSENVLLLQASVPASSGREANSRTINIGSWDGKTLACAGDLQGGLHIISRDKEGTLVYRKLAPRRDSGGFNYYRAGPEKPVSSYGPFPARKPARPAMAVDGKGNVHVCWIERDPAGDDPRAANAVMYTCLREG